MYKEELEKNELLILGFISKFEEIPLVLLEAFFPSLSREDFMQCLLSLSKKKAISPINTSSAFVRSRSKIMKYSNSRVDALWAASVFAEDIDIRNIGVLRGIGSVFFVKKNDSDNYVGYNVAVFRSGDEYDMKSMKFFTSEKYIFVLPSVDSFELYRSILLDIPGINLSNIAFCVLGTKENLRPKSIDFYPAADY